MIGSFGKRVGCAASVLPPPGSGLNCVGESGGGSSADERAGAVSERSFGNCQRKNGWSGALLAWLAAVPGLGVGEGSASAEKLATHSAKTHGRLTLTASRYCEVASKRQVQ